MVGNVSNYFFQLYAGRALGAADYGALNALLAVLALVSSSGGVLLQVMARYASRFVALGRIDLVGALLRRVMTTVLIVGAGVFCLVALAMESIRGFFHLSSFTPVLVLAATIPVGFIGNALLGALLGCQWFGYASLANIGGVARLLAGVLLIGTGLGVTGGIAASLVASLLTAVVLFIPLRHLFQQACTVELPSDAGVAAYSLPVLVAMLAFTSLTTIDVVLARHYLPHVQAGLYAAAAVLAKTALYLPSAVVMTMFPMVSSADTQGMETTTVLRRATVLTVLASGGMAAGFALLPGFSLTLLLGHQFVDAAPLLRVYGCATVAWAVLNLVMNFNLARHRTAFAYWLVPIAVSQVLAVRFIHESGFHIVVVSTLAAVAGVAVATKALRVREIALPATAAGASESTP